MFVPIASTLTVIHRDCLVLALVQQPEIEPLVSRGRVISADLPSLIDTWTHKCTTCTCRVKLFGYTETVYFVADAGKVESEAGAVTMSESTSDPRESETSSNSAGMNGVERDETLCS